MAESLHDKGYVTKYAGVDPRAPNPVTDELIAWADVIMVARSAHADVLKERFDVKKRVISLDVRNNVYTDQIMREQVKAQLHDFNLS